MEDFRTCSGSVTRTLAEFYMGLAKILQGFRV